MLWFNVGEVTWYSLHSSRITRFEERDSLKSQGMRTSGNSDSVIQTSRGQSTNCHSRSKEPTIRSVKALANLRLKCGPVEVWSPEMRERLLGIAENYILTADSRIDKTRRPGFRYPRA